MYLQNNKSIIFGISAGLVQLLTIILFGLYLKNAKATDLMAIAIYFRILLPFSCLFLVMSAISGWLYKKKYYKVIIKYSILFSIIISTVISTCQVIISVISFDEIVKYIVLYLIIILPILLIISIFFKTIIRHWSKNVKDKPPQL